MAQHGAWKYLSRKKSSDVSSGSPGDYRPPVAEIAQLKAQIAKWEAENAKLRTRMANWKAENAELRARIAELERQAKRKTPQNSSLPVERVISARTVVAVQMQLEAPTRRSPGHPKHQRRLIPTEQCDKLQTVKPQQCRHCGARLSGNDPAPVRHQVEELPEIKPIVAEYQRHRWTCPQCGATTCGPLPPGVPEGLSGPRWLAFVGLLMAYFRQSKRRRAEFLDTSLGLPCSMGLTVKIQNELTAALRPVDEQLAAQLPS